MGSVGFVLKLSACILIFLILDNFCVTCNEQWCYDKRSCRPDTWGSIGSCSGKRQSPINIDTKTVKYDPNFSHIHFNHYEDRNIAQNIVNSGSTLQVNFEPKATIYFKRLSAVYFLTQVHFHWGTENSNGAEHTIDGRRYGMEMHLVHTKNNMSIEDASKQPDGLVVLSFFIQKTKGHHHITAWDILANLLKKIPEKGNSWNLRGRLSVASLLHNADLSHYYLYDGSLTTPPCAEAVRWVVFATPLTVSSSVFNTFINSLFFTTAEEGRRMRNNFRPVQALNGRSVYYFAEHKSGFNCFRSCLRGLF